MNDNDLANLAALLAKRIKQVVPIEHQLWDPQTVADYLGTSLSNFQSYVAPHPKFPRPIRIPNTKGQRMQPRYLAMDVIQYMDDCKDR